MFAFSELGGGDRQWKYEVIDAIPGNSDGKIEAAGIN
jgi:hypothetical protein